MHSRIRTHSLSKLHPLQCLQKMSRIGEIRGVGFDAALSPFPSSPHSNLLLLPYHFLREALNKRGKKKFGPPAVAVAHYRPPSLLFFAGSSIRRCQERGRERGERERKCNVTRREGFNSTCSFFPLQKSFFYSPKRLPKNGRKEGGQKEHLQVTKTCAQSTSLLRLHGSHLMRELWNHVQYLPTYTRTKRNHFLKSEDL